MKFQIELNYGDSCKSYIYFETTNSSLNTQDLLKKIAIGETIKDCERINHTLYIFAAKLAYPTIKVFEYKDGKKVRNGIRFKCKWR